MAAGRLNKRITIQVKSTVRTDTGGVEEAWVDVGSVWAHTWGATGQEKQIAATSGLAQVFRHFRIRYYLGLTSEHRVLYAGQSYNVSFVNHVPEQGWTYFDAKEIEGIEAG